MPDGTDQSPTIQIVPRIADVTAAEWDSCAGTDNPFVSHAFLDALEQSRSVGPRTGWLPQHLTVRDPGGRLAGAVPLYVKSHSYGEYVFDHAWANAYQRAGGQYYPKLQAAVPFTPVTGPRLLVRPDAAPDTADLLVRALESAADGNGLSGVHVTFPREAEWERLGEAGWLRRLGVQYHWENRGYGSFDDFLGTFSSRKRKAVRKERRTVAESGLEILTLTGDELKPDHWDAFFRFYTATSDRKWGSPYLTRDFFHRLGEAMPDKVVLVMAREGARWVAGALNLLGGDTLYGRNWGGIGDYPFLHFEACYYRAIDFAIERGLKRVEAGAQGEHKIQRGYLPAPTYSAHYITDPGFRRAIGDFLDRERAAIEEEMALLAAESPYRRDGAD
ncbi:MAG TPA: GNAT family N-acetyltransferase [Azospirillaceae bacterium]|nr:GNAT family N-acetyltransferase [Azospirillaceae bacterium]